jgi:hypothetical protein
VFEQHLTVIFVNPEARFGITCSHGTEHTDPKEKKKAPEKSLSAELCVVDRGFQ